MAPSRTSPRSSSPSRGRSGWIEHRGSLGTVSICGPGDRPYFFLQGEKCRRCGTLFMLSAQSCRSCGYKRKVDWARHGDKSIIPQDFFRLLTQEVDELVPRTTSPPRSLTPASRFPEAESPEAIAVQSWGVLNLPEGLPEGHAVVQTDEHSSMLQHVLPDLDGDAEPPSAAGSPGAPTKASVREEGTLATGTLATTTLDESPETLARTLTWGDKASPDSTLVEMERTEDGYTPKNKEEVEELETALWRLRTYLRHRFGTADEAWDQLLTAARRPQAAVHSGNIQVPIVRADELTMGEVKIAMSRLRMSIPEITGFPKVTTVLRVIDRDNSGGITKLELLGDDKADPSLLLDPPQQKEPWTATCMHDSEWDRHFGEKSRRAHSMPAFNGLMDKELTRQHTIRTASRPTRPQFKKRLKAPEGYVPHWKNATQVFDRMMHARDDEYLEQQRRLLGREGCTYRPNVVDSGRSFNPKDTTRKDRFGLNKLRTGFSIRNHKLAQSLEDNAQQEVQEHTFEPASCERSLRIHETILASEIPRDLRLHFSENHFHRIHHMEDERELEEEGLFTFKPELETAADPVHTPPTTRKRVGPIWERLFHHTHHEYWHSKQAPERTAPKKIIEEPAKEAEEKSWWNKNAYVPRNKAAGSKGPASSSASTNAPTTPASFSEFSSSMAASPREEEEAEKPGELTMIYRPQMQGLLEACQRWTLKQQKAPKYADLSLTSPTSPKSPPCSKKASSQSAEESQESTKDKAEVVSTLGELLPPQENFANEARRRARASRMSLFSMSLQEPESEEGSLKFGAVGPVQQARGGQRPGPGQRAKSSPAQAPAAEGLEELRRGGQRAAAQQG